MKLDPQDKVLLRLYCASCDNVKCTKGKKFIHQGDKAGCTRWINEEEYAMYIHYIEEVVPFWKLYNNQQLIQSYLEISNFLEYIYQYPIVHLFDNKDKVIGE